jgi:hypothetical protein
MNPLKNHDEVLLRQVNPLHMEDGEPSSQAFWPHRDIDEGQLSVDRSTLTTAANAHALFTTAKPNGFGGASEGTWGLTVGECTTEGLSSREDPVAATAATPANPAHAVVDFAAHTKSKRPRTRRNSARSSFG